MRSINLIEFIYLLIYLFICFICSCFIIYFCFLYDKQKLFKSALQNLTQTDRQTRKQANKNMVSNSRVMTNDKKIDVRQLSSQNEMFESWGRIMKIKQEPGVVSS